MSLSTQPERKKVVLRHPIDEKLEIVLWEGSLAELLRKYGYTEVIEAAHEAPLDRGKESDGRDFYQRTTEK